MKDLLGYLQRWIAPAKKDGADVLVSLILATREDTAFRDRLLFVLRLPLAQREPLVRTAMDEMRLRGEPLTVQQAFATLATEEGARTALQLLRRLDTQPVGS